MAIRQFFWLIKSLVARILFAIHAILSVWRVVEEKSRNNGYGAIYWLLLLPLIGIIVDAIIIQVKNGGHDWKWFSPTVFFYLGSTVPSIWLLELGRLQSKKEHVQSLKNVTQPVSVQVGDLSLNIHIPFNHDQWVLFIEQAMILILICARWLMPKGELSRDQKSSLLLAYLGIAADIVELFAIFDEPGILNEDKFIFFTLTAWSASLLQFTLVLTATRARGFRTNRVESEGSPKRKIDRLCFCVENEIWSILVMLMLLDFPFLALRLMTIFYYKISTYTIYFFTAKNVLVILLQGYRMIAVCQGQCRDAASRRESAAETNLSALTLEKPYTQERDQDKGSAGEKNEMTYQDQRDEEENCQTV